MNGLGEWLTVEEAAKRLRTDVGTVKARARRGALRSLRTRGGFKVFVPGKFAPRDWETDFNLY